MADKMLKVAGLGKDGQAKPIKMKNDGTVNTVSSLGQPFFIDNAYVLTGTESTGMIVEFTDDVIIDHLEWAADYTITRLTMEQYIDGVWVSISRHSSNTAGAIMNDSLDSIAEHGHRYWDIINYDTNQNFYKVTLKRPLVCAGGFRIRITGQKPEGDTKSALVVNGRRFSND